MKYKIKFNSVFQKWELKIKKGNDYLLRKLFEDEKEAYRHLNKLKGVR